MNDDDVLMDTESDRELNRRLMDQDRPQRPHSLREARRQVELLVALGLSQTISRPEATVEATRVTAWLENFLRQSTSDWGRSGLHTDDGGQTFTILNDSGEGGVSVRREDVQDLIDMLIDARHSTESST